ncbi:hypothetical protein HUU61_14305 [Rhodopseudomonas palustris]|nr:hypothetical protein [Rhodopseudomonas palustris]
MTVSALAVRHSGQTVAAFRPARDVVVYLYSPRADISARLESIEIRGLGVFALLFALGAVIDAVYFKGRYLDNAQQAIFGLTSLRNQIGR